MLGGMKPAKRTVTVNDKMRHGSRAAALDL
jgi:hypothetical protein